MKYVFFFATPKDILPVLESFEANEPLKFVEIDILPSPNRGIYLNSSEIPKPGVATCETGNGSATYMVSRRDTKNILDTFVDVKGQRRWGLSNGDNEETTLLTLAGLWKTGTLLPGNMSTLHKTPVAQQLMRWFQAALRQAEFTKIDIWWVGPESLAMLKAGKRLTQAEQSPPEFDLKLSSTSVSSMSDMDPNLFG